MRYIIIVGGVYVCIYACVYVRVWGRGEGYRAISDYETHLVSVYIRCTQNMHSKTGNINPFRAKEEMPQCFYFLFFCRQTKRQKKTEAFTYLVEPDRYDKYNNQCFLLPWTRTEYNHKKCPFYRLCFNHKAAPGMQNSRKANQLNE